jgi:hypothetical protein
MPEVYLALLSLRVASPTMDASVEQMECLNSGPTQHDVGRTQEGGNPE